MRKLIGNPKTFVVDSLYYIVGSILYSAGLYTFALMGNFAPGGVSGLTLIITHFTGLPIGILALIINVPLIVICGIVVGPKFLTKSIYTMLICTLFLDVVFPLLPVYEGNRLLAAIFSGVLLGAGLAVFYMRGSSSGGSDFIIMSVKKVRPHLSIGRIMLATDAVVILLGGIAFGDIDAVLYGILSSYACSMMIDNMLYGTGGSKLAIVITNKAMEISQAISGEIERGSTMLKGTGTFTGQERELLLCACAKNEIYKVRLCALAVDPVALVMVTDASEVFGEGFAPVPIPGNETPTNSNKE